jgi:hypothetical protein
MLAYGLKSVNSSLRPRMSVIVECRNKILKSRKLSKSLQIENRDFFNSSPRMLIDVRS